MNEREHIALTEAQIIAAEKGEIQLEYRNGEKVCQVIWLKPPFMQDVCCLNTVASDGCIIKHKFNGEGAFVEAYNLFVSEQDVELEPAKKVSPKPPYEVGEIIEMSENGSEWYDVEIFSKSKNVYFAWRVCDIDPYHVCRSDKHYHRKKQTEKTVTLENKVMTVKEAFKYLTNL